MALLLLAVLVLAVSSCTYGIRCHQADDGSYVAWVDDNFWDAGDRYVGLTAEECNLIVDGKSYSEILERRNNES